MSYEADFSDDRVYRYTLRRRMDSLFPQKTGKAVGIALNPSTADEAHNDPTVLRFMEFVFKAGYEFFCLLNLYAYRSTNPQALGRVQDPVGPLNDLWIRTECREAALIVVAWGNWGKLGGRAATVMEMIRPYGSIVKRLGQVTQEGEPRHPLYLPGNTQLHDWNWKG